MHWLVCIDQNGISGEVKGQSLLLCERICFWKKIIVGRICLAILVSLLVVFKEKFHFCIIKYRIKCVNIFNLQHGNKFWSLQLALTLLVWLYWNITSFIWRVTYILVCIKQGGRESLFDIFCKTSQYSLFNWKNNIILYQFE